MTLPFNFKAQAIIDEGRTTRSAVDTVKKWLETTSLPPLQEEFIVLFLLSCTNDTETAKKTIQSYFRIKNKAPQIFSGWNTSSKEMLNIFKVINCCVIPRRLNTNTAVIFARLKDTNYRNCDIVAAIKLGTMVLHVVQKDDPPDDVVIICDIKGLGFMHLSCIKVGAVIPFLEYVQDAVPLKIKGVHILNSNYVFDRALDLFKFFIKSELLNIIYTYSSGTNLEEFYEKFVPASHLPKEYGGDLPFDDMVVETVQDFKNMQTFFDAEERLRNSCKI